MNRHHHPIAVDVISDDEHEEIKRPKFNDPKLVVIEDDPTPQKPNANPNLNRTPSFIAETPLSDDVSIVKCSISRALGSGNDRPPLPDKFAGITGFICLESDNEPEDDSCRGSMKALRCVPTSFGLVGCSQRNSSLSRSLSPSNQSEQDHIEFCSPINRAASVNYEDNAKLTARSLTNGSSDCCGGTTGSIRSLEDDPLGDNCVDGDVLQQMRGYNDEEVSMFGNVDSSDVQKEKHAAFDSDKNNRKKDVAARKQQQKEEKARLLEEKKRKRLEQKLEREALKAEAAEKKKLEKETQKWEKGKFAMKSIVAEIDAKVVENGSIGGYLLTRFAEKGISFRITSNPIERSILWQMSVPDQIVQLSSVGTIVPYVLLVYQAEEFCDLISNDTFIDHVRRVQSHYPSFTVCYLTNKLMSYINRCEQQQYKKASDVSSWRRPPVEEVLSKLTTHFTKVHSRQCIDEAELAEHVVGLTSSLANCQFRKKLTQLSVYANGSIVPKDFIDRNLIKKNLWLKALVAIPKVQPRYAMAIWKKYPTMRSLLNAYMDPHKSVHEKEFLLKDLMIEGLLGKEDRRLGEMCSKRIYRILMAQSGGVKTDDVEDGADFFDC